MNHRGIAILLVLVVLVVAVTASTNVARISAAGRLNNQQTHRRAICDDLRSHAESICQAWLAEASADVALPPDLDRPTIPIVNDRVETESGSLRIAIQAVDLMGMLRSEDLSSIGVGLPEDIRDALHADSESEVSSGPDMLRAERLQRPVYPTAIHRSPVLFGDETDSDRWSVNRPAVQPDRQPPPSVCELISFRRTDPRNHPRDAINDSPMALNVNTAPAALLSAAFMSAGLDALDRVMAARSSGVPATLNIQANDETPVSFVSRSDRWGFRIDVRAGTAADAWWVVFEQSGGSWQVTRRLAIHE